MSLAENDALPIRAWTTPAFSVRYSILPPLASRTALATSAVTVPTFEALPGVPRREGRHQGAALKGAPTHNRTATPQEYLGGSRQRHHGEHDA